MIIFSKDGKAMINTDQMENIFVGGSSVKINMASGRGCQLGTYQTETEAKVALQILARNFINNSPNVVVGMPTDEEVKTRIEATSKNNHTMTHYDNGQKKKRYGGS